MSNAGTPPFPDNAHQSVDQVGVDAEVLDGSHPNTPDQGEHLPPTETADRKKRRDHLPFVVQSGTTLYLVADEPEAWVLAQLEFDTRTCQFSIVRQAHYRWPREALGRLLSRVMVDGDIDDEVAERMCTAFGEWMITQFAA